MSSQAEDAPPQPAAADTAAAPTAAPPAAAATVATSVVANPAAPAAPAAPGIEVDLAIEEEGDPGYATDDSTATTSLASSVRDYVFENNRRYHKYKEGRYLIPNDNEEQQREDMKHTLVLHLCGGKLHYAPLKDPKQVLDIGTGTGIWAIDMGDEYPGAELICGIDLSPIQPSWVPPNVKFLVDDAEADWLWEPNSFDYIHVRHMAIAIKNWPRLLSQAYKALKPGGWIELQDNHFDYCSDDNSIPLNDPLNGFVSLLNDGIKTLGFDLHNVLKYPQYIANAGFDNISHETIKIPVGPWPKDPTLKMVGLYNRTVTLEGIKSASFAPLMRGLKWSLEQVEVFLVGMRGALMNSTIHSYFTLHIVYGQKPLDAT